MEIKWEIWPRNIEIVGHLSQFSVYVIKNPEETNLHRGKGWSAQFQRFQAMVTVFCCFQLCGEAEEHDRKYTVE